LKDPLRRAGYLLELAGRPSAAVNAATVDDEGAERGLGESRGLDGGRECAAVDEIGSRAAAAAVAACRSWPAPSPADDLDTPTA
jgi:hypothetical protein